MHAIRPFSVSAFLLAAVYACGGGGFETCEETRTCEPDGDGDGDASTGGTGDGDGDGDGDNTGGSGDGDGDTGGTGTGGGSGGGDGDGDATGGMGGDPNDPCLECEGDTPHCNPEDECVECLTSNHCSGNDTPICDTDVGECVECVLAEECGDPELPMCGSSSSCVAGCESADDCTRFGDDLDACDTESGACVQCTPDTEEADCGAKSCDPATFTCGPNDRESRGTCRSCISDSDCVVDHHCVPMEYPAGTPRDGGYCLKLSPGCERPYSTGVSGRTTLSGITGETYCGINEDIATCEAVRALEDDWLCDSDGPGDGQCWPPTGTSADAVEVPGAICRTVGVLADRCTYPCAVDSQCLAPGASGDVCGPGTPPDPVTPDYCGGEDN